MNNDTLSDEALLRQVAIGNRLAFNSLYERFWEQLFLAAYKVLQDEDGAKDAVQDVFVDLWQRRADLKVDRVGGYLFQAVKYQVFKQLRKVRDLSVHDGAFDAVLLTNNTEEEIGVNELQLNLDRSLNSLPEKYRLVYEMSRVQHLSNKEIAQQLQLSTRTVDWYLHAVLKHLKTSLSYSEFLAIACLFFW